MLNYVFTTREKILLLVCAILALIFFYYEVAYKGFEAARVEYDTTSIQTEVDLEIAKANRLKRMEEYIEEHAGDITGTVEQYDNLSNEVNEIGKILVGRATDISISWSDPVASGTTVRRVASISFIASDYDSASDIISDLADCKYRCLISNFDLQTQEEDMALGNVRVSLNITFFETIEGLEQTPGLTIDRTAAESAEE